jgi:GT2 family glycosyltransferase
MIYCVVLNWNNAVDTIECLESLKRLSNSTREEFRILCVDNFSSDGSYEVIKNSVKDVEYIRTKENLGYSGGNNACIKYALENGADHVWILNNDTIADKEALNELIKPFEKGENIGATGSLILRYDDRSTIWFAGGIYKRFSGGTTHFLENKTYNKSMDKAIKKKKHDFLSGCSFMVSKEAVEKTGLIDESLYLLFEEMDYFIRLRENGYKWQIVPESVIYHKVSKTLGLSPVKLYYFSRNMVAISKKHFPLFLPFVLLFFLKWPLLSTFVKNRKNSKQVVRALIDGMLGKGGKYEG